MLPGKYTYRRLANYLALYFFIGILVLGIILFSISQILIQRLQAEYNKTSTAYAIVLSMLISSKIPDVTDKLTSAIGDTMSFPAIVTDVNGNYIDSKNLGEDISYEDPEDREKLNEIMEEMDSENEPIPIISYRMNPNTRELEEVIEFYFHYRDPNVIKWLRFLPVAQIVLIAAFFLIGLLTYRNMKRDEHVALWVGMAKETAHQIGTPISSLLGWIELLSENEFEGLGVEERDEIREALSSMRQDVERLRKISDRFASIGARPTLKEYDLERIVRRAVKYSRQRLPLKEGIEFVERYKNTTVVLVNPEQLSWCIENLFKNSIRSLEDVSDGRIVIEVDVDKLTDEAKIVVEDNGAGMDRGILRNIFSPGFTTKTTGWGMGLSLVKRIVEDYHQGRIEVESEVLEGSRFIIYLPISDG